MIAETYCAILPKNNITVKMRHILSEHNVIITEGKLSYQTK